MGSKLIYLGLFLIVGLSHYLAQDIMVLVGTIIMGVGVIMMLLDK